MTNNERAEGGETDGDEQAGLGDATEEAISEAILPTSVEVNGEPVGVTFDESIALVHGQAVVATTTDAEAHTPAVTCACINNKVIKVTIVVDKNDLVATKTRKYCRKTNRRKPRFGRKIRKPKRG